MSSIRRRRLRAKKKAKAYKPPEAEDLDNIVGRWKVDRVEFQMRESLASSQPNISFPDYAGVEVTFDDQCDVSWALPPGLEVSPLFQTASFNIEKNTLEMFGGHDGKTFSFDVEVKGREEVLLITEVDALELEDSSEEDELSGFMTLALVKSTRHVEYVEGFTLQGALDEGYFADLTVTSNEGSEFKVHRLVLSHTLPSMSSRDWEVLLATQKSSLVRVLLSYAYTHRLPTSLSVPIARELLSAISSRPRLSHLTELCKTFIGSHDLKQRLLSLVDEVQACLELGKRMVDNTDIANPVKVTYTIKQLAKEAAAGAAKFGLLCELYSRNKKDMSKPEKMEVLEYVRARVVVFIDLLCELIDAALAKYTMLSEAQRLETATYIIPEVERVWDLINSTCESVKVAMQSRLSSLAKKSGRGRPDIKISLLVQLITRGKEAKRLYTIGKEFDDFLQTSSSKREDFKEMTEAEKVAKIMRAIEGLEKEGNTQRTQLQGAKAQILVDNALDWKKFKVLTSLCCTYVSWGLQRAQNLREPMLPTLLKACKFVQRADLNQALLYLDLLTEDDVRSLREDDDDEWAGPQAMPTLTPPSAGGNVLARECHKLLGTDKFTDMEFVVCGDSEEGGVVTSSENVGGVATFSEKKGGVVIKAHRVIVASRCEWMKRALLSGMKEAIDRRIVVRDCSESTFHLFLSYLYGGSLELDSLPIETVVELLTVADQYETSVLRGRCEMCLVGRVEDGTVFPLLQVADRYCVRRLREMTLQHILNDPDVLMRELDGYSDLSDDLKQELRTLLSSQTDPMLLLHHTHPPTAERRNHSLSSSGSSDDIIPVTTYDDHTPFRFEEAYHDSATLEFQDKLDKLRAFVSGAVSDDVLRELLIKADMDVNRAVNFYLNEHT